MEEEIKQTEEEIKHDLKEEFLKNPIDEYIEHNVDKESTFKDLFESTDENVDMRTDLAHEEIILVNKIEIIDRFLKEKIGSPIYHTFLRRYMRLKFSLDRKSRAEFVDVNRKERFEQNLQRFGNFQNLSEIKK